MLTGLTSSSSEELDRLRQRYERLCDLVTRTAEADPDAAERVLGELQEVSEQLLVLEAAGDARSEIAADTGMERLPEHAADQPVPARDEGQAEPAVVVPDEVPPASSPPEVETTSPAPPVAPPVTASQPVPPRVVAFRVTPSAEPLPAPGAAPRSAAAQPPASGSATVFSAAIRQWLERRREPADAAADVQAGDVQAGDVQKGRKPPYTNSRAAPTSASAQKQPEPQPEAPPDLTRIASAVEQQAAQIERILTLCEAHQVALERLEARIEARLAAAAPAPDPDTEIPDLRAAVEEQRQRVTALAKTIHNLAQWLAAQRIAPGR